MFFNKTSVNYGHSSAVRAGGRRRRAALLKLLAGAVMSLSVAGATLWGGVSSAAANSVPKPDPKYDARLKDFLSKRFRLSSPSAVQLGEIMKSPFPGLYLRAVTLTNDKGQSAVLTIFGGDKSEHVILGQLLDLSSDPWGRVSLSRLHLKDRPVLGAADAPVTIVEFADFQCPFCARAFGKVENVVRRKYPGKVKLVFKNFPLRGHQWALPAAIAGECIRLQNPEAFWRYAEFIYSHQPEINAANLREKVDSFARRAQLDTALLDRCLMSTQADKRVTQDLADGAAVHVSSTPTFFVDDIPLSGMPDERAFDRLIATELARKTGNAHR